MIRNYFLSPLFLPFRRWWKGLRRVLVFGRGWWSAQHLAPISTWDNIDFGTRVSYSHCLFDYTFYPRVYKHFIRTVSNTQMQHKVICRIETIFYNKSADTCRDYSGTIHIKEFAVWNYFYDDTQTGNYEIRTEHLTHKTRDEAVFNTNFIHIYRTFGDLPLYKVW